MAQTDKNLSTEPVMSTNTPATAGPEFTDDLARWEHYLLTGEHVSAEDADAWLAKLAAGEREPCPW